MNNSGYPSGSTATRAPRGHNAGAIIDLRSDTVTKPGAAMRKAMAEAEVGDDVYGDDPSVLDLESHGADLLGKEAALFCPSGTQTNLVALLTHCGRADQYLVGDSYHTFCDELGGSMALGGICANPLPTDASGKVALERFAGAIQPPGLTSIPTKLIALENTTNGRILPLDYQARVMALARDHGLKTHLDGARMMNAAVKLGVPPRSVADGFDSVSLCLSKGLGAPVGSLLLGPRDFIARARRWRKMLGGGMRQAGVIAAAGLYALQNNIDRLADDHRRAARLAEGLNALPGLEVEMDGVETNMLFVSMDEETAKGLKAQFDSWNILVNGPSTRLRLLTHLDVNDEQVEAVIQAAADYLEG